MARYIRVAPEVRARLLEFIDSQIISDGVLNISTLLKVPDRRAKVHFSEIAWIKIQELVMSSGDEVAWHGIARKSRTSDDYYIDDIIVYPQIVSGAYVDTDQDEYTNWLASLSDDIYNTVRMHGHSHVNMGVTPSQTDINWYSTILRQLSNNDFYIFMIFNKQKSRFISIYDFEKNILFETNDCDVLVGTEIGIYSFLKESEKVVRKKVYQRPNYPVQQTDTHTGYQSSGYSSKKKWGGKK